MPVTELFSEVNRADFIVPASRNQAEILTAYVSMRDYHKAVAIIQTGAVGALGTVNAKLVQATNTLGAGAKDIVRKAITALDAGDDNVACVIELDCSELDVDNGFDCIALQLNTGGNVACLTSAILLRYIPRFKPVDDSNLAEVVD